MKFREDFVTNSSSSSYIVIAKVDICPALLDEMKEEFGKYGIKMLDENVITGKELIEKAEESWEVDQYVEDYDVKEDGYYITAKFYTYSTDGDTDGEDAWLYERLPEQYLSDVYEGEPN